LSVYSIEKAAPDFFNRFNAVKGLNWGICSTNRGAAVGRCRAGSWHGLAYTFIMKKVSVYWSAMKKAVIDFNNDNGFKLAASLSYSMIFSIGPMMIVVISLAGIFWGQQAVEGRIYEQIRDLVGSSAAMTIQELIRNIQQSKHTTAGAIIGGIVLVIGATGVFAEIQGSINYIWSIQTKPKKGWLKLISTAFCLFR
jgi:membrane protein